MKHPIGAALLAATAALTLSGCMGDDYGYGGGVSLGYGSGYGGGYYGDPYGWYDDYYYPGAGYYIYDRGGRRYSWNDNQRRYWEGRRGDRPGRENWKGFRRDGDSAGNRNGQQGAPAWRGRDQQSGQALTDEQRQQRREAWQAQRQQSGRSQGQGLTDEQRQQRRESWQAQRQSQAQSAQPQSQGNLAAPTGDPAGRGNRGGRGDWGRHRGD